jgi:hypothetical protein
MAPDLDPRSAAIRNAAWLVRHYALQRTEAMRLRRAQAIAALGLAVRQAFNETDDFEPLLVAIVDGLRPRPEERPF